VTIPRLSHGWLLLARLTTLLATFGAVALAVGFARRAGY